MQQIADWLPWAHRGLKAWHHCLLRCYRSRSASGIRRWLTAPRSSAGRRSRHCSINLRDLPAGNRSCLCSRTHTATSLELLDLTIERVRQGARWTWWAGLEAVAPLQRGSR